MKELYDKDMREALFSYFEDTLGKIRFLEEITMGKSRADAVMITENEMVGFELKSDKDSLARLGRQIPDYDRYYDRNYLVVGEHFESKAYEVLPSHWGIIKVYETKENSILVEILRESDCNPKNPLKKQLEFLWRNELINIVKAHKLGGVSAKNKHKLAEMLFSNMEEKELKRCILEEMLEREYPKIYYYRYKTPDRNITFITDGYVIKQIVLADIVSRKCDIRINDEILLHREIKRQFDEYFSGKRKEFDLPMEKLRCNSFTRKVYEALRNIPYGETRTYGEIAKAAGREKAYRAVGSINHKNPFPIIVPCHRVIGANGKLTGYAGGTEFKEMLLSIERNNR